jgi:hypothetical protein
MMKPERMTKLERTETTEIGSMKLSKLTGSDLGTGIA